MRKVFLTMAAAAMTVVAAPAMAQSMTSDNASENGTDMEQVVCQRESVIGSRVQKRRACMTRREWVRLQNAAREDVGEFIRRAAEPSRGN
jgi:hypothetical protein